MLAGCGGSSGPQLQASAPGRGIFRQLVVHVTRDGRPVAGAHVTAVAAMTEPHAMSMLPVRLYDRGGGTYSSSPVTFAMPAPWHVTFRCRTGAFTATTVLPVDVKAR